MVILLHRDLLGDDKEDEGNCGKAKIWRMWTPGTGLDSRQIVEKPPSPPEPRLVQQEFQTNYMTKDWTDYE